MASGNFLKHIPLFQHLSDEERGKLANVLKELTLRKGELLFSKGSKGDSLFIVKKGRIKIFLSSPLGDEVVLAIFSEGDFFGEMSLLDGMPRSADAMAIETTELFTLSREDFLSFLHQNEKAMQTVLMSLSLRLRKTDDLLEDTCFLQISERFAKKLLQLAAEHGRKEGETVVIDLAVTQRELAGMVGASRESINKELRVLREKGIVTMRENIIFIHNLERLRRRAR